MFNRVVAKVIRVLSSF